MKIGIIGVGAMGAAMATNLLARGYDVHVRDVMPEREQVLAEHGAHPHPTPSALLAAVEVAIIVVETATQVREVLSAENGLLAALATDNAKTVILCPTIAPDDTERFAADYPPLARCDMMRLFPAGPSAQPMGP